MEGGKGLLFFLYLIVAVYLGNMAFNFLPLSEAFTILVNKWALVLAGVLILIAGFKFLQNDHSY